MASIKVATNKILKTSIRRAHKNNPDIKNYGLMSAPQFITNVLNPLLNEVATERLVVVDQLSDPQFNEPNLDIAKSYYLSLVKLVEGISVFQAVHFKWEEQVDLDLHLNNTLRAFDIHGLLSDGLHFLSTQIVAVIETYLKKRDDESLHIFQIHLAEIAAVTTQHLCLLLAYAIHKNCYLSLTK